MEQFYITEYGGGLEGQTLRTLLDRAQEVLDRYQRLYRVTEITPDGRKKALCAMADCIHYFQQAQNGCGGLRYAKVGTVSVSGKGVYSAVDISPAARERELYRCACRYLDICRAVEVAP